MATPAAAEGLDVEPGEDLLVEADPLAFAERVVELLHQPEVPAKVVINEAVELARRFGAEHSPQFVNGILDRFLREANIHRLELAELMDALYVVVDRLVLERHVRS